MAKTKGFYMYEWRTHRGATQQELADAIGLLKGYISELERGKKRYNQDHLERMAKFFDCSPGDILNINPLDPTPQAEVIDIWSRIPDAQRAAAKAMLQSLSDKDIKDRA